MSQLPAQAIDEFQALWKKHYGIELPREQAIVRAYQVINLMRLLGAELPPTPSSPSERNAPCANAHHKE